MNVNVKAPSVQKLLNRLLLKFSNSECFLRDCYNMKMSFIYRKRELLKSWNGIIQMNEIENGCANKWLSKWILNERMGVDWVMVCIIKQAKVSTEKKLQKLQFTDVIGHELDESGRLREIVCDVFFQLHLQTEMFIFNWEFEIYLSQFA